MTFLVGQQGSGWTVINQGQSAGGNAIVFNDGYTATPGTATHAKVWINDVSGAGNVKVFVYDAGGALVGQSAAINVSGAGIPGLLSAALDSSIVLTAQIYKLVVAPDTGYFVQGVNSGSYEYSCDQYNSATFSYSSPPSTLPSPTVADDKREFIVWLDGSVGSAPTVTDVGDETLQPSESIAITGTGFGASQGAGKVYISPTNSIADGSKVEQAVTSWGDTSITITVAKGALGYGAAYLFVQENGGSSNATGYAISLITRGAQRSMLLGVG